MKFHPIWSMGSVEIVSDGQTDRQSNYMYMPTLRGA